MTSLELFLKLFKLFCGNFLLFIQDLVYTLDLFNLGEVHG